MLVKEQMKARLFESAQIVPVMAAPHDDREQLVVGQQLADEFVVRVGDADVAFVANLVRVLPDLNR